MGGEAPEGRGRVRRGMSLAAILVIAAGTLAVGAALRQPCAAGDWSDGRQYRRLCYTDIVPLLGTEHLDGGRLPYLDPCPPGPGQCDEYPVLTMYAMRAAAWVSSGFGGFFWANAALLAAAGLVAAGLLHRVAGDRALYLAAAPTLLVYSFVNWDLLAVALATGGTVAHLRRKDALSGALLGLGAAAKLYPGLLVIPFAIGLVRAGRRGAAATLAVWAGIAWAAANLPFAVSAPKAWFTFFRFNSERPVDWDSLWFVACTRLQGSGSCAWSSSTINLLSAALFVAVAAALWAAKSRVRPGFAAWTFGFPLLVAFLLTNKVYSPQFSLWLLPWFALALPNLWLFVAFSAADVAVFVTRFTFFGRLAADGGQAAFAGFEGVPLEAFQVALAVRALILVACLVAWVRRRDDDLPGYVEGGLAPAYALSTSSGTR